MIKKVIIALLLVLPIAVWAENKVSPFTRIYMDEESNATTEAERASVRKAYNIATEEGVDYVSGFLYLNGGREDLEELGVVFNSDFDSLFTVQIPVDRLEEVLAMDEVKRFEMGHPVKIGMKNARGKSQVDAVYNGTGTGLTRGYKGTGVAIGVVDIGFQFDHINFYKEDYSTTRVKAVWNQNKAGSSSSHPAGYGYGIEYDTTDKILSAKKDGTDEAHATHVAGIAGGATSYGNYRGVAPDADLYFVSTNCEDDGIIDGIQYIFKKAEGKPCVINLSLGSHTGPHDGTSTFDRLTSAMVGQRKILVGAAGNEGSDYIHVGKTFNGGTEEVMHARLVDEEPGYSPTSFNVDVWGATDQNYTFSFCVFDEDGDVVYTTEPINACTTNSRSVSLKTVAGDYFSGGSVQYASEKNSYNNKGNVLIALKNVSPKSGYSYGIEVKSSEAGTVNAWIDAYYWSFYHSSAAFGDVTKGDNNISVGEIGGIGEQIISVGSFDCGTASGSSTSNTKISTFSSLGPTADGRMKPDVIAPGCVITSSVNGYVIKSRDDMEEYSGVSIYKKESVDDKTYAYGGMQGTSMASPFVTGVIALWLENARWMDLEKIRSILQSSSSADSKTGVCPNNSAGYGKIDALAGLLATFTYSSLEEIEQGGARLIVYPNPVVDDLKVFFPKRDKNVNVTVWSVNGQLVYSQRFDEVYNLQTESIDFSSTPKGMYMIRVTGDKTNECFKISK